MTKIFFLAALLIASVAQAEYSQINGIKMYYEVHGTGAKGLPLVMIHGGGSTIDSGFSQILPLLAKDRKVIAFEEQGHGRTEDRAKLESFTQTADDAAALLKHLKIERADVFGFSNGASSAMQFAIRHPENIRKLIFVSSFTKKSGAAPGFWDYFKIDGGKCELPQELKDAFLKVNPDEAALERMCLNDTARMRNFIETPDRDVKKIKAPTLVMMGDQDVVTVSHGVDLVKLLPNARLAVLPGNHGSFMQEKSPSSVNQPVLTTAMAEVVLTFLALEAKESR